MTTIHHSTIILRNDKLHINHRYTVNDDVQKIGIFPGYVLPPHLYEDQKILPPSRISGRSDVHGADY